MNSASIKVFFDVRPESRSVIKILNYICLFNAVMYPIVCWPTSLMIFSKFSLITSIIPVLLNIITAVLFHKGKYSYGVITVFLILPFSVWYKILYEPLVMIMLCLLLFGISGFLTLQKKAAINLVFVVSTFGYMLGTYYYEMKYNSEFPLHPFLISLLYLNFAGVIYMNMNFLLASLNNYELSLKRKRDELEKQNKVLENQNEEILNQSHQIILRQRLLDEASAFSGKIGMILSHDVRLPLKALENIYVSYNANMISKEDFLNMSRAIEKDVIYINSIFEDILDLAREQRKEKTATMEYFDIGALTNEICDAYYAAAKKKSISIFNMIEKNEKIFFNAKYYKIIIRNLIANALKFTQPEGVIKIFLENAENEKAKITVEDTGIGISKTNLANLKRGIEFDLRDIKNDGMGIGLAFCNDLLKSADSVLHIESELDKGSKFYFYLERNPKTNEKIMNGHLQTFK